MLYGGSKNAEQLEIFKSRLAHFPPGVYGHIKKIIKDGEETARGYIRDYMFKGQIENGLLEEIISDFRTGPHSRPIRHDELSKMGLKVEFRPSDDLLFDDAFRYLQVTKSVTLPDSIVVENAERDFYVPPQSI
jgi:hypothetical protein